MRLIRKIFPKKCNKPLAYAQMSVVYIQRTTPRGIAKRPVRNPLADRAKSAALNQNLRLQSAISKCKICTLKDVDEHRPLGFP